MYALVHTSCYCSADYMYMGVTTICAAACLVIRPLGVGLGVAMVVAGCGYGSGWVWLW